jgi:hypothetical protein
MEENLKVTGAATTSCYENQTVKRFVQCHVFAQSQPGRHPIIKTQAILHSAYSCVRKFHAQYYMVETQSDMCIYRHTLRHIEMLVGQKK